MAVEGGLTFTTAKTGEYVSGLLVGSAQVRQKQPAVCMHFYAASRRLEFRTSPARFLAVFI
jgi:hypothetical protein